VENNIYIFLNSFSRKKILDGIIINMFAGEVGLKWSKKIMNYHGEVLLAKLPRLEELQQF
jgi:hypothetical protein